MAGRRIIGHAVKYAGYDAFAVNAVLRSVRQCRLGLEIGFAGASFLYQVIDGVGIRAGFDFIQRRRVADRVQVGFNLGNFRR